ncbi:uncharacterized protein I303_102195 [Kwoniella dejecticola CBS 10117]|uniref:AN1-type domain-containing protein n=1 Tax=Kwoniella dejecticola CBS 10117 TaxID=1296121 RepID=A0A1A6ABN2_9TREE|nr:uncharacterized protein I303_01665 [Kwoniella dejecticola CBS 10117]OBR87460.1 hypothetical protein I303_01665 [Kwoniella dejecticola CBS 10117]
MSILTPGSRCTLCPLVDFLPYTCPSCNLVYCRKHIQSPLHQCIEASLQASTSTSNGRPGKLDRGKRLCGFKGCQRESIESIAGYVADDPSSGTGTGAVTEGGNEGSAAGVGKSKGKGGGKGENEDILAIAKQVRCAGCGVSFCVEHRSQSTHECPAPLDHNVRHDAFLEPRQKAREVVARQFPEYKDRVIAKPPPAKDVIRRDPATAGETQARTQAQTQTQTQTQAQTPKQNISSALGSSSLQAEASGHGEASQNSVRSSASQEVGQAITATAISDPTLTPSQPALRTNINANTNTKPKIKSKDERLWDIHLKKIRIPAEPLLKNARMDSTTQRVFFEWTIDLSMRYCKAWVFRIGKWAGEGVGKFERSWVDQETPVGKIMDILIERGKVKRPVNMNDPTQSLHLVALHPSLSPNQSGQVEHAILDLSRSAKDEIPEGSLLVLVRGQWD